MKKLFSALGFKKPDEMEKSIQLKSIRLAWIFTVIFLVVWGLYENHTAQINNESANLLPVTLLISQNFVLGFSQLFFRFCMTKGGSEEKESLLGKIIPIVTIFGIIVVILGLATYFITYFIMR